MPGIFEQMTQMDHEQIVHYRDSKTGLKAIVGIHDRTLGPALGGARVWTYKNESDALFDVLRLSRGMTYKNAVAELRLGGGKAVIILGEGMKKTKDMMVAYGKLVESLSGKYITAEDVGMTTEDIEVIAQQTSFVMGRSEGKGGLGTPSPLTAWGTYLGIKAACKVAYGTDSLENKTVALQGTGHVGVALIQLLQQENCHIYANDYYPERLSEVCKTYTIKPLGLDEIYDFPADIYAPCALGATINDKTLSRLKCRIIAGCANNQLEDEERHGTMCIQQGILYVPDFIINCGGVVKVYAEYKGFDMDWAKKHTETIYTKVISILTEAIDKKANSQTLAINLAKRYIEKAKNG